MNYTEQVILGPNGEEILHYIPDNCPYNDKEVHRRISLAQTGIRAFHWALWSDKPTPPIVVDA